MGFTVNDQKFMGPIRVDGYIGYTPRKMGFMVSMVDGSRVYIYIQIESSNLTLLDIIVTMADDIDSYVIAIMQKSWSCTVLMLMLCKQVWLTLSS